MCGSGWLIAWQACITEIKVLYKDFSCFHVFLGHGSWGEHIFMELTN